MSERVSMSRLPAACSGLIDSGVPMSWRNSVNSVFSVSRDCVALAMPKSITFTSGLSSALLTRTFDGFRSR